MYQNLYRQVIDWIPERARVLDLGTGDGEFLEQLVKTRRVSGEGVELNPELVTRCIDRGLAVHQGDVMDGLDQYGDGAFDYVLLLGTFQELKQSEQLVREALRVGRKLIVSYSNFAHVRVRWQMLLSGRSPMTKALPSPWYRTPNIHFFSILDFQGFCEDMRIKEVASAYFNARGLVRWLPNLRAEVALSLLEGAPNGLG
ncbi:MAG: methionine biosynthesis protein MetW [Verrucomicrobia bacterium]|nr:methionine biosynthesis protein MetW [Verrucomicrobiota bacterium]